MPLLKPPDPKIATRRLYLRIEESLAQTAERYAQFLGTDKLDHVVSQALEFIFKRDAQFKQWLTQHPPTPETLRTKTNGHEKTGGQQ